MSQLPLLGGSAPPDLQPETVSKSKNKAKARSSQSKQSNSSASAPKRIASPAIQMQADIQASVKAEEKPAPYGLCRVCGSPIAIPGLDASLCSNPIRTCGSSGWVTDSQWRAAHSNSKGGKA
jgi:RNA polymerase-binding transcription factor DksA